MELKLMIDIMTTYIKEKLTIWLYIKEVNTIKDRLGELMTSILTLEKN